MALGALGAYAETDGSPVTSISPAVLTVQVTVEGVPFGATPLYYPNDITGPVTGMGVYGSGGPADIVLVEVNGTLRETVSSTGNPLAVILYGDVEPDYDWKSSIPVVHINDGDALRAELTDNATITITYGRNAYFLDGVNDIAAMEVGSQTFGVAVGDATIQIIDITDPEHMTAVVSLPHKGTDVEAIPDTPYALVTHVDGVYILDMSRPYQPYIALTITDDTGGYDTLAGAIDVDVMVTSGRTFAVIAAFDDDGIQVIDITDPLNPVPASSAVDDLDGYDMLDGARGVDIASISGRTYGVITSYNDDAIQIIDMVNPYLPLPVSSFDGDDDDAVRLDGATDVEVVIDAEEAYAIVTSYNDDALQIVNITTPAVPESIRSLVDDESRFNSLAGASDIDVVRVLTTTYGLVSGYKDDGIQIIDLNNPSLPRAVGNTLDEEDDHDFYLDGVSGMETIVADGTTYLLAAAHLGDGMQVMSLSKPATPVPVADVSGPDDIVISQEGFWGMDTFVQNGRTYTVVASYHDDAIQIIDVTNPYLPLPISNVFDGDGDFEVLAGASDVETVSIAGRTYGVVAAYADNAIQIVNLTDPANPQFVQEILDGENGFEALGGPLDVEVAQISGRAYAVVAAYDDDAIQIIDLIDPRFPLPTSDVHRGDTFIADEDIGEEDPIDIRIIDGSRGVAITDILDRTYCLVVGQNDDSLLILDVTNPAQPWPVSILYDNLRGVEALNGAADIEIVDANSRVYALIAGKWEDGMQVLDITDPTNPRPVAAIYDNRDGYTALRGISDIEVAAVSDRILAVVSGAFDDAVQFIDVTDPANPAPLHAIFDGSGGYHTLDGAGDVEVFRVGASTYAMVAGISDNSIQVVKLS